MARIKRTQVSIRVHPDDYKFLDNYCAEEGIEKATWMSSVIRKEVKRIQQQEQQATTAE